MKYKVFVGDYVINKNNKKLYRVKEKANRFNVYDYVLMDQKLFKIVVDNKELEEDYVKVDVTDKIVKNLFLNKRNNNEK